MLWSGRVKQKMDSTVLGIGHLHYSWDRLSSG